MSEGVQGAVELCQSVLEYLIARDKFFGTMFAIVVVIIVIMYFLNRFTNHN